MVPRWAKGFPKARLVAGTSLVATAAMPTTAGRLVIFFRVIAQDEANHLGDCIRI